MRRIKTHVHTREAENSALWFSKSQRHYSDVITSSGVAEKSGAMTPTTNAYKFEKFQMKTEIYSQLHETVHFMISSTSRDFMEG